MSIIPKGNHKQTQRETRKTRVRIWAIWYNILLRPVPGTSKARFEPRALSDADLTDIIVWFNRHGFPTATKTIVVDAVLAVSRQNIVNPCRDYLESVAWDKVNRIDGWLDRYIGVQNTLYTGEVGRKWLISAVSRALNPGCKADSILIFEGPQGARKSSALRALTGEAWFGDSLPPLGTKDASTYLRGMWIVEISELLALRRSDIEQVKSFLSRQEERYRPPYGRTEVYEPRRCVFAGTTNRSDYLRDETGNRRFWPVRVGKIDVHAIERDRDQLWAEAVAAYRAGEPWWLEGEAEAEAIVAQSERHEDDPWFGVVLTYVSARHEVACKEILQNVLMLDTKNMARRDSQRVAKILLQIGFTRIGKFTSGPSKDCIRFVRNSK